MEFNSGSIISVIAVDDFLVTASAKEEMGEFYTLMLNKYNTKRMGRPKRFLGWIFQYKKDVTIALLQMQVIFKTFVDVNKIHFNGKILHTPKMRCILQQQ